ncbi:MAG: hypothetical protein U0Q08_12675 [Dermatophilaceae bacterium]
MSVAPMPPVSVPGMDGLDPSAPTPQDLADAREARGRVIPWTRRDVLLDATLSIPPIVIFGGLVATGGLLGWFSVVVLGVILFGNVLAARAQAAPRWPIASNVLVLVPLVAAMVAFFWRGEAARGTTLILLGGAVLVVAVRYALWWRSASPVVVPRPVLGSSPGLAVMLALEPAKFASAARLGAALDLPESEVVGWARALTPQRHVTFNAKGQRIILTRAGRRFLAQKRDARQP